MMHDFKKFPELVDESLDLYFWQSPHEQIFDDFDANCTRVKDGDTIEVITEFRDFPFSVRFSNIAAPEKGENMGLKSKDWLRRQIEGEPVFIHIDPNNRAGKWGRLIGQIFHKGLDVGELSILAGKSVSWSERGDGSISDISEEAKGAWS